VSSRGSKSFSSRRLNMETWKKQIVDEGKYQVDCIGLRNKHLPRLTAANLLHQIKFTNSHGSSLSFNARKGHLYSTYHKPRFYFSRIFFSFALLFLLALYPLNSMLLYLSDNLVRSQNLLFQQLGLATLEVLVQVGPNKKKLLENGIAEALSVQVNDFAASISRGDVTSWNSDFDRNLNVVAALLSSQGAGEEILQSSLFDSLTSNYELIRERLDENKLQLLYEVVFLLSEASPDCPPIYEMNKNLFIDMLASLHKELPDVATHMIYLFSLNPDTKDKRLRVSVLTTLKNIMNYGGKEYIVEACKAWNNLSRNKFYRYYMFEMAPMQAFTFAVYKTSNKEALNELAESLLTCNEEKSCRNQLLKYNTMIFSLLKLSQKSQRPEVGKIIYEFTRTPNGRKIVEEALLDLKKSDHQQFLLLRAILAEESS